MALTAGAIERMFKGTLVSGATPLPTLQLVDVRKIPSQNGSGTLDRYRLILSDGQHYQQAMLATQLNHLVESDAVAVNSTIVVKQYVKNAVQGRVIIILLEADVVETAPAGGKIGDPKDITSANLNQKAPPAPAPAPPAPSAAGGGASAPYAGQPQAQVRRTGQVSHDSRRQQTQSIRFAGLALKEQQ